MTTAMNLERERVTTKNEERTARASFDETWREHVKANEGISFNSLRSILIKRGVIIPHASNGRNWRITHTRTLCLDGVWR